MLGNFVDKIPTFFLQSLRRALVARNYKRSRTPKVRAIMNESIAQQLDEDDTKF